MPGHRTSSLAKATASGEPGNTRDPWTCPVCGVMYVVPSLADDCRLRHEAATR